MGHQLSSRRVYGGSLLLVSMLVWALANTGHCSDGDFQLVADRYRAWLLDDERTDYSRDFVRRQYEGAVHRARQATALAEQVDFGSPADLYDTRKTGPDRREVHSLVTQVLPDLSAAYQLKGANDGENPFYRDHETLKLILQTFDRLDARGFRSDMQMPWKAKDAKPTEPPTAIIADFHLRTSGYAVATFLMQRELRAAGRLERSLQTCRAICGHDEKTGGLDKLKLNADAVRIATNFILPYALAAGDSERLKLLKRQFDRSMAVESDASDTIKPDGLGFHHLGVYLAGYAPYAVSQAAQLAWLFHDTDYALEKDTIVNIRHSFLVLRVVSQKYDMHKALAGRLRAIAVIPDVMFGYAYLAALEGEGGDRQFARVLARLCDHQFLESDRSYRPFSGHRDEATPGPAAVDLFFRTLDAAEEIGAEEDPVGHWALNYGPLSVHRRNGWMVSVKGFNRYLWSFERSLTDGLNEERRQNVLGYHDSSGVIRIYGSGDPVNAMDSGYDGDGWDWCRLPGTTTRHIPAETMLTLDQLGGKFNRPFGDSGFAGGVSMDRRQGVFAMKYAEVGSDDRESVLRANKSVFFFDDQIVVLASNIRNGDGVFPVGTTLYQCRIPDSETPTWVNGSPVRDDGELRFKGGEPVTLVDPAGNGYYVSHAENLVVRRSQQTSLDDTATRVTRGKFGAAWFDHGTSPRDEACAFVVLVQSGPEGLAEFASHVDDVLHVLQQDEAAHVVQHVPTSTTGYALFQPGDITATGIVSATDVPCLVLTKRETGSRMQMSVCNPDLGWEPGRQFAFRPKDRPDTETLVQPTPAPVKLDLQGHWILARPNDEVSVQQSESGTEVCIACSDGRSIEFILQRDIAGKL